MTEETEEIIDERDPTEGKTLEGMRASEEWYHQRRKERYQSANLEEQPQVYSEEEIKHWETLKQVRDQDIARINNYLGRLYQATGAKVEKQLNLSIEDAKITMGEIMKAYGFTRKNFQTANTNIPEVLNIFIKWGLYHSDMNQIVVYDLNGKQVPFDVSKGIYLYGKTGRGKTILMEFLSQFTKATGFRTFPVVNVKEIMIEISVAKSLAPIKQYLTGLWCFNDIAAEEDDQTMGSRIDLVERIFHIRADNKKLTLATGNIPPKGLPDFYSERIVSRFYEMFNMVELKGPYDFRIEKPWLNV